jgi:hypothetical protein
VVQIHSERFVDEGGSPQLESTDVWLDTRTRGARLASTMTLPLRRVASEPGGIEVYVGRDERPDGKRLVQFVLRRRPDAPAPPRAAGLFAARIEGTAEPVSTGCGHVRVAMAPAIDGAETAVLSLQAILPPLGPGERSVATSLGPDPSGAPTEEIRSRALHLHLGVSQTPSEREPRLSVSASWGGREQLQRVPTLQR